MVCRRHTLLERVPDALSSLGLDAALLKMMKYHCGLPPDTGWTEMDTLLGLYLDVAERLIDETTGITFRPRSYVYTIRDIVGSSYAAFISDVAGRWWASPIGKFTEIRLTRRSVTATPAITWADNDGNTGTFTPGTDYVFNGGRSLSPLITFLPNAVQSWPQTGLVPWPFKITFTTIANDVNPETHKAALLMLASHYYRNPEAMGDANPPTLGPGYDGLLTSLQGSFL